MKIVSYDNIKKLLIGRGVKFKANYTPYDVRNEALAHNLMSEDEDFNHKTYRNFSKRGLSEKTIKTLIKDVTFLKNNKSFISDTCLEYSKHIRHASFL